MMRIDYKRKLISINRDRPERWLLRIKGNNSNLRAVLEHFGWYAAGERSENSNRDHRVKLPKFRKHREEIETCELVSRDRELPLVHLAQLLQRDPSFASQVNKLLRVFPKQLAGISEGAISRRPVEQRLSHFAFELANRLADCRLRAIELLGSPRETALARHSQEHFELKKVHSTPINFALVDRRCGL